MLKCSDSVARRSMSSQNSFLHSPVKVSDSDPPMYEVCVERTDDTFVFAVGHQQFRIFKIDTLPDEVKVSLAIIHTINWDEWLNNATLPLPPHLRDVGWMRPNNWYVLILSEDLLNELRGQQRIN